MSAIHRKHYKDSRGMHTRSMNLCKNLDQFEATALIYLRLWQHSSESRQKAERDFIINLGHVEGYKAKRALEELFELVIGNTKRKLIFQSINDIQYSDDEGWFLKLLVDSVDGFCHDELSNRPFSLPSDIMQLIVVLGKQIGGPIKKSLTLGMN